MTDAVGAIGLAASSLDISLSKATSLANALSISNSGVKVTVVPALSIMGKAVTGIGIGTSLYSVVVGITKDGSFDVMGQDGLNALAAVAGLAALATPIGWWALGLSVASSGISIGIAIYDAANPPQ